MIGLDTNVLGRYLVQDDEAQSSIASNIIDGLTRDNPGFIGSVVLAKQVGCWATHINWVAKKLAK